MKIRLSRQELYFVNCLAQVAESFYCLLRHLKDKKTHLKWEQMVYKHLQLQWGHTVQNKL